MLLLQRHIFRDVRSTLFCDMFALHMKITLQLRFVFVHHSDVFFITSQLHICLLAVVMFFDDVRIILYFRMSELHMEIRL